MSAEVHFAPQVRGSKMVLVLTGVTKDGDLVDFAAAVEIWLTAKLQLAADAVGTPVPDADAVFQKTKTSGAITSDELGSVEVEVDGADTESLPDDERMLLHWDIKYLDVDADGPWTPAGGTIPIWPNVTVSSS